VNGKGVVHPNFLPAISRTSMTAINKKMRSWHIQIKNDKSLDDLSKMFDVVLKGWYNYYGKFYPTGMCPVWKNFNRYLVQWVRRKYKRLAWHKRRAYLYLNSLARANPSLFTHWKLGIFTGPKVVGAG
jgi:RNA-directed DNA polymerase